MDIEQWDKEVRPYLAKIRDSAGWIVHHAVCIQQDILRLKYQPDFATEAEGRLTDSIQELEAALFRLKASRESFRGLQVEKH